MADANITILGNLTKDPVQRNVGQTTVCNFTVAVRTSEKGTNGEYLTNFYEIVWYGGKLMDYVMKNVKKGMAVVVSGEPIMYSYVSKQTGATGYGLRLKAHSVSTPKGASAPKVAAAAEPADAPADDEFADI